MDSSLPVGSRPVRRFVMRAVFVMALATILMPAAAEAAVYVWVTDRDSQWEDARNWQLVSGSPNPRGYPNAPGDVAAFTRLYSKRIRVSLLPFGGITVGTIIFAGDFGIELVASRDGFLLDNGASPAQLIRPLRTSTFVVDRINAEVILHSDLIVDVESLGSFEFLGPIGLFSSRALTKRGAGPATFKSGASYTGTTTVEEGQLVLNATGSGLAGPLVIGTNTFGPQASVHVLRPNQLSAGATVTVNSSGTLQVDTQNQIAGLKLSGDGRLLLNSTLTTGLVESEGGIVSTGLGGRLVLQGDFRARSGFSPMSVIGLGSLDLLASMHTFTVDNGPGDADLDISIPIVGSASAGLRQDV